MNFNIIPFYNILNMFFVGVLLAIGFYILFPNAFSNIEMIPAIKDNGFMQTALALVVLYYLGFFIDRLGSLVLEKLLKNKNKESKRNFVSQKLQMNWRGYSDYQRAEKHSVHLKTLAREYTFSRNSMTLFLILTIAAILADNWLFCSVTWCITIFLYFSTKKHADKISQRVDYYKNHSD